MDSRMAPRKTDRRRCLRNPVYARVRISHSVFGGIDGVTADISDSGVFARHDNLPILPVGSHINLQFLDSANPEIRFNAKVTRQTPKGIGLVLVDYEVNGQRFSINELKKQWLTYSQFDSCS